jgi:hypothetical protein
MSGLTWDPFANLRRARQERANDDEAQALLADATTDHGDVTPDVDQGQRTPEPTPNPSTQMNTMIRRAAGVQVRPGHETPPPEIHIGD